MPGPLLRRGALWFNSCKRPPPVSDHSVATYDQAFSFFSGEKGKKQLFPSSPE